MPSSSSVFITVMGTMNSKEKYDMDTMYGYITEFSEYDALNDWHEKQGYDGSNFLPLAGSLTVKILLIIAPGLAIIVVQALCRQFYYVRIMRQLGTKLEKTEIKDALLLLIFEQYLELSATISICLIFFYDNLEMKNMELQDRISTLSCFICGITLVFIPVYMSYRLN